MKKTIVTLLGVLLIGAGIAWAGSSGVSNPVTKFTRPSFGNDDGLEAKVKEFNDDVVTWADASEDRLDDLDAGTLSGDLSVAGNAAITSNLVVIGTVTASGLLDSDTTGVTGNFDVATNLTVGGAAIITGAITGSSTLDVDSVTVDAAAGIDTQSAGALAIGAATATSVVLGATDVPMTYAVTYTASAGETNTLGTAAPDCDSNSVPVWFEVILSDGKTYYSPAWLKAGQ